MIYMRRDDTLGRLHEWINIMSKKNIIISMVSVILIGVGVFGFLKFKNAETPTNNVETSRRGVSTTDTATPEKNYYEINDELAGVSFKIGKKFDRMPAQQLQMKNPNFVYGFISQDDAKVNCFISQTKRENPGIVKVAELRDGVLEQLKKSNPDVRLDEAEIIEIGENNNKGAKLKMSYKEEENSILQWETAGITDKAATFAFCGCPKAVIELYEDDFNLFLDSVRIHPVK